VNGQEILEAGSPSWHGRFTTRHDRRAAIKRRINEHLGSRFIEEKAYTDYGQPVVV